MTKHFGYWVFGRDMNNVNLKTFKNNGVTDIFLNYAAFKTHGESKVLSWIEEAKKNNINIHIWMQCFYDGEWHNPAKTNLDAKINEATKYANMKNVKGVHLDYVRYPGNAYKTTNADKAVTNFVKAVRNKNPNTFLSCAIMPENDGKYYYGQDINELGKIVNAVIPMQYKGNYKAGTSWLASTTSNFTKKAKIWSGLQAYKSDDDTTLLSNDELSNDIKTCLDNKAEGVLLFRYGLSNNFNFNKFQDGKKNMRIVSDDVFKMAQDFKNYVENNHSVPYKFTYHDTEYFTKDMTYAFVYKLYHLKDNFDIPSFQWAKEAKGDNIIESIKIDDYKKQALNVYNYILKNKQVPDYVKTIKTGKKVNIDLFTYCLAKVLVYYKNNNKLPDTCEYNYRVFDTNFISKDAICQIANKVKEYVAKNYAIPSEINGVRHGEYTYLFAKMIVSPGDYTRKGVGTAPSPSGTYISRTVDKKDYIQLAKNLISYIEQNKRLPNFLSWNGYQIKAEVYEDAFARVVSYYYTNNAMPAYVNMNSNAFTKPEVSSSSGDAVFDYFVQKFGKVSTIDDALEKVQDRGYGYYYDDVYSNKTSIDRMYSKSGVNCTDSCQVFWHIAKALGYEVQCLHVKCSGGDGHVRLRLRNPKTSGNEWFLRDPAAVLDRNGASIEYNWCTSGYRLIATNPSWFLANVNR